MARLVLVGVFLLILASVVDGSSSSSRRSYRIRGSPRQSMSGLFRSLCSAFREPAVIVDEEEEALVTEPVVSEITTVPPTTTPKQCMHNYPSTDVKREVVFPEFAANNASSCTEMCDRDPNCIEVVSYDVTPLNCILNMGRITLAGMNEASCLSSCESKPECLTIIIRQMKCQHFNRIFTPSEIQYDDTHLSTMYWKACDQVISGTTTVTTPFADQTGNESDCWCPCDLLNNSITTDDELRRWVQTIISGLAVDKKLVSQTIRKKTSASDDRPSAQGIGYVGVLVIVLSFLAIVFLDLQSLVGDFKRARLNIRKLLEESEPSPRPSYSHTMHQDVGDAINRPKIKNQ